MLRRSTYAVLPWTIVGCTSAQAQTALEPTKLRDVPLGLPFEGTCVGSTPAPTASGAAPDPTVEKRNAELRANPLGELNDRFHDGNWTIVQEAARFVLDEAMCRVGPSAPDAPAYDYRVNYIWLTWIGQDAFDTHGLHRLLVHVPATAPYKLDLPGVTAFYEVFASLSDRAELTAVFVSTEKADETLAQIPSVVEKAVPALFGLAGAVLPKPLAPGQPAPPTPKMWVTPLQIELPAKRASVAVTSVAGEPVPAAAFIASAERLALRASFQTSRCGRDLAIAHGAAAKAARNDARCQTTNRKDCLDAFDEHLNIAFAAATAKAGCSSGEERKAMAAVDDAFRTLTTTGMAREVKSDFTFANRPLQRVSFGIVEAVAFKASVEDPRVELDDDGNLKADPLPRLLTIVTVNSSFQGYDPTTIAATAPEKLRWFGGAVIVPDFGIAGGVSYLPIRGVALNIGVGRLFTKSAASDAIGAPPADATDPFDLGSAWVAFAGVGYNFK